MLFQSWSRHPRDQRGAKDTSKTCSKKRLLEDRNPSFFHYFSESSASPRRGAKNGAKIASRRLPRSLWGSPGEPPGSQHRSTFRLWAPPGDPTSIFWVPPGASGTPPGSLRSPVPAPGRSRSPPEAIFKPPSAKIIVTTIKPSVLNKKCDSEQTVQLLIAFLALSLLAKMPSKADFFNPAYIKHHVLGCRLPLRRRLKYCK